jgi:hypothetical protein
MREFHRKPLHLAAFLLLAACSIPPSFPLKITDVSASPDPVVGKVVELSVEVESSRDEEDVTILIQPPEAIQLVDGDLTWNGSLQSGEPFTHRVSLCTLYEGDWRIHVTVFSRFGPDDTYGDSETMHFISTHQSGEAIPGYAYRIDQPSPFPAPTAKPVAAPADCSR